MDESGDLTHLIEGARGIARLPAAERIRHIRADRWIGYPRAVDTLNRLESLLQIRSRMFAPTRPYRRVSFVTFS
ncbi:TniB family NTP-binding protein [Rhodococcus sp. NPDC058505]|uniref:TniB family NTP-binding protein n=1 Tax=Rhodococcus sp. NPDC058505 TaxID=3346531 RepID=UPI00365E6D32